MGLVPHVRLPLQLVVQLLLLPFSGSQQHPPGSTGWPVEGSAGPGIVEAALGTTLQGAIDSPGGSVWYSFDAANNHAYVISTGLVDLADSTLTLWETTNSSGLHVSQLASDDDSGLGLASLLIFVAPRDGTFYVRVRGYSVGQVGRFSAAIVDVTDGMGAVGPSPCVSGAGRTSCVLPRGCITSFNANRETCPGGGAGSFSCESLCASRLVPWYERVEQECQQLLTLMPEWHSYTALSECDAAVYGGPELAILIRVGETQAGRVTRQGYQEWFRFQASSGVSYVITTTLDGQHGDGLRDSVLTLYSADGTTVLMMNDDYDGLASQISWTAPSTHCLGQPHLSHGASGSCTHFLMVRGYNGHDLGSFDITLEQWLQQGPPEVDLCTENGDRVPWRAIEFRSGCEVWVTYEEVSDVAGQQNVRMQLLEVDGVSVDQLLQVTSDICGSMDLARAFAEDFEGVAELAGVSVSGDGETGQVQLAVRSSSGAVTHPVVTFTQMNQRYTRAQWRDDYDEGIFSGRTCPAWTDSDSAVTAEVAVEGSLSPVEFQNAIVDLIAAQTLRDGVQPDRLVTITSYLQTMASAMIIPGAIADFVVNDADRAEVVSTVTERQAVLRRGVAESINCCVADVTVTEAAVVITGVTSATVGRRRQLQSVGRVRISYQLVTESARVVDWVGAQFYPLRLASSINDADTAFSIEDLGVLNFAFEDPDVTTTVEYTLDTAALSPDARSSLVLDLGTEATVVAALNRQLPTDRQIAALTFVSLHAATGTDPQCATYLFASLTGSDFLPTLIENGAITGNEILLGDESLSTPIDLLANGLRWHYFQRLVRWIVVSSNGFVYVRGDDAAYAGLSQLSTGRGSGERLPAPSYGAVIAPYWEDYDPSGVHCGNSAGRVHWKISPTDEGPAMVVEFDRVKACGGGTSGTKNIASWQLVLKGADDSFDIVISHARGDSGLHTIGFQDWQGKEGQMMCHGEGDSKCFKQSTTYRVTSVRPSYSCHRSGVCATAAVAAQGGGPAGSATSSPRYAACECPDCFAGDGLSACVPESCSQSTNFGGTATADTADTAAEISFAHLVVAVLVALIVGVGGNTVCHRWRRCPMYRAKVVPQVVYVTQQQHQPQQVVIGTIVGQPPLPVGALAVNTDGPNHHPAHTTVWEGHNDDREGVNPLIAMASVVNGPGGGGDGDEAKRQQGGEAWATGGAADDSAGGGSRVVERRAP